MCKKFLWNLLKSEKTTSSFSPPSPFCFWNSEVMPGTLAVFLDHEDQTLILDQLDRRSLGS